MTDHPTEAGAVVPRQQLAPHSSVGRLRASWRLVRRNVEFTVGLAMLAIMLLVGFLLPLPYDPEQPDSTVTLVPPSSDHWFGTDGSGFDVFSRTVAAAHLDLPLALSAALVSLVIGVPLGLMASSKARWAEGIMRGLDVFQAFPLLVLAIVIVALTGNNLRNVVVAIALVNIPRFIRMTRSEALTVRETRFVEAAYAMGASRTRVMSRHMLPNVMGVVLAQASLATAHAIVVIATLSFLGIGIAPPQASWGAMIRSGADNMATGQWWIAFFPGLAVFVAVLSCNAIADGVNAIFDGSHQ